MQKSSIKILREYQQLSPQEWGQVVAYYKTHTARETAAQFGLRLHQALITALAREYKKNAPHGGARKGAGNPGPQVAKLYRLKSAVLAAKAVQALHVLPDPDTIDQGNADQTKKEVCNILRATIAEIKKIITVLE